MKRLTVSTGTWRGQACTKLRHVARPIQKDQGGLPSRVVDGGSHRRQILHTCHAVQKLHFVAVRLCDVGQLVSV